MSNIWLTRPLKQADGLIEALSGHGAQVLHLPMLEIEALAWDAEIKARVLDYDQYDLAFFISTNAATLGMDCISHYWPQYPSHIKNFALGPSSAAVLESYDLEVIYPVSLMSSEVVLAMPELDSGLLKGRKVLIFRGQGGREVLAEGLREKGARVDYIELYQRKLPQYSPGYLQQCLSNSNPDALVISSGEALDNLVKLFNKSLWPDLLEVLLFVSSPRIKGLAKDFGFEKIIAMPGANDGAIIKALKQERVL